jgi:hypothetical protein
MRMNTRPATAETIVHAEEPTDPIGEKFAHQQREIQAMFEHPRQELPLWKYGSQNTKRERHRYLPAARARGCSVFSAFTLSRCSRRSTM